MAEPPEQVRAEPGDWAPGDRHEDGGKVGHGAKLGLAEEK